MKLKAPEGVCSVSINGELLEVPESGIVEVNSASSVADLQSHGFVEVVGRPTVAKAKAADKAEK